MKKGFKILQANPYQDTDKTIRNYYFSWREFNKGDSESKDKETFAMLFTSFKDKHLADIDGGALKLYLFFCFNSSNNNGESWYSIEKISEFFNKGTRTINKWIKTLVDKQLIYRDLTNHKSFTTFLLPYSTTLMKVDTKSSYPDDTQVIADDIVDSLQLQKKVFGELVSIYHLFQWKYQKGKRRNLKNNNNVQWLLFITKRENGILTGHFHELKNSENLIVSKKHIDDSYFFLSPFLYEDKPVLGIALDNESEVKSTTFEVMKKLIEYLAEFDVNSINPNQLIEYKEIEEEPELDIEETEDEKNDDEHTS